MSICISEQTEIWLESFKCNTFFILFLLLKAHIISFQFKKKNPKFASYLKCIFVAIFFFFLFLRLFANLSVLWIYFTYPSSSSYFCQMKWINDKCMCILLVLCWIFIYILLLLLFIYLFFCASAAHQPNGWGFWVKKKISINKT